MDAVLQYLGSLLWAGWTSLLDYLAAHVLLCLVPAFIIAGKDARARLAAEAELLPVRLALVRASRRAGLAAPVDGVTTSTQDLQRLVDDTARSRRTRGAAALTPSAAPAPTPAPAPARKD